MKLTITLTAAETVESIMAFGIEPMLSGQLVNSMPNITFINFDEKAEPFKACVNRGEFTIKDAIAQVFESAFGFDGHIERLSSPEKVVMKNGDVITDYYRIENLIDKENIVDEIAYSEVTIDLGQSC